MKTKWKYFYLDDFEHRLLVGCLMTSRNEYLREGITEQLKAEKPMAWVRRMNNIRNRAMEIVNTYVIFIQ